MNNERKKIPPEKNRLAVERTRKGCSQEELRGIDRTDKWKQRQGLSTTSAQIPEVLQQAIEQTKSLLSPPSDRAAVLPEHPKQREAFLADLNRNCRALVNAGLGPPHQQFLMALLPSLQDSVADRHAASLLLATIAHIGVEIGGKGVPNVTDAYTRGEKLFLSAMRLAIGQRKNLLFLTLGLDLANFLRNARQVLGFNDGLRKRASALATVMENAAEAQTLRAKRRNPDFVAGFQVAHHQALAVQARICLDAGEPEKAIAKLQDSERLAKDSGSTIAEADATCLLARALTYQHRWDEADAKLEMTGTLLDQLAQRLTWHDMSLLNSRIFRLREERRTKGDRRPNPELGNLELDYFLRGTRSYSASQLSNFEQWTGKDGYTDILAAFGSGFAVKEGPHKGSFLGGMLAVIPAEPKTARLLRF